MNGHPRDVHGAVVSPGSVLRVLDSGRLMVANDFWCAKAPTSRDATEGREAVSTDVTERRGAVIVGRDREARSRDHGT